MILEHHIPDWVVAVSAIVLLAAAVIASEKGKQKFAYVIEGILAVWYFLNGWWIMALVWVALIAATMLIEHLKRKHKAKKAAEARRVDESVANSAGTPDDLPY